MKIAGGLFGGIASFIAAYWAFVHGREKSAEGEAALEWLYYSAAGTGAISGVSTVASGFASGLDAINWMKPRVSVMVRARAAFFGIRAGLIGIAVSLFILSYEDEPIAQWMDRTIWGRRPKEERYINLNEELKSLDKLTKVSST